MKCPFCQQELEVMRGLSPSVYGCPKCKHIATIGVWEELDRTKKQLEIAVDALKYANKCIKGGCVDWKTEIDKALEQITALEQKDIK